LSLSRENGDRGASGGFEILQQGAFFPPPQVPAAQSLYAKGRFYPFPDGGVVVRAGDQIDLSTYFNTFDVGRWKNLTGIQSYGFSIASAGRGTVCLYRSRVGSKRQALLHTRPLTGKEQLIRLPDAESGLLSVTVRAETDVRLYTFSWIGLPVRQTTRQRVVIVICTYRRESYLAITLCALSECLPHPWQVYVVDNGCTVNPELVQQYGGSFTLFPNENTGGSGGFARGIKEAIAATDGFEYVLLMDDDVFIAPHAVQRTATLLSHLRPEYRKHFVSGAMLRLDKPTVQHEATAYWNGWRVRHVHGNLELGSFANVSQSCIPVSHRRQYAAWWYCAIPIDQQIKSDLPAPFFLNGDDIEYSLRRAAGIIHLNGIAIWHESFAGKVNAVKHVYLTVRNGLIINLLHNYSLLQSLQLVLVRFVIQQLKGSRSKSRLILEAMNHVIRGPDFVREIGNPSAPDFSHDVVQRSTLGSFLLVIGRLIRDYRRLRRSYQRTFLGLRIREAA